MQTKLGIIHRHSKNRNVSRCRVIQSTACLSGHMYPIFTLSSTFQRILSVPGNKAMVYMFLMGFLFIDLN